MEKWVGFEPEQGDESSAGASINVFCRPSNHCGSVFHCRLTEITEILSHASRHIARLGRAALTRWHCDELASFGPDHPNVAIALNNQALLLKAMDRLSDAEPLYRRELAIDEASLGPEHPKVAVTLHEIRRLGE
jgi:Tetratricopeptide repeat